LLISIHRLTLSTGIMDLAPLYNTVAMVEVALSTSMITTIELLISYRFNRAGDKDVYNDGLAVLIMSGKYTPKRHIRHP